MSFVVWSGYCIICVYIFKPILVCIHLDFQKNCECHILETTVCYQSYCRANACKMIFVYFFIVYITLYTPLLVHTMKNSFVICEFFSCRSYHQSSIQLVYQMCWHCSSYHHWSIQLVCQICRQFILLWRMTAVGCHFSQATYQFVHS